MSFVSVSDDALGMPQRHGSGDGSGSRLTVGFDGSAQSIAAVMWTAEEAVRRNAIVHVVACYSIPTVVGPWISTVPYSLDTARAATDTSLDDLVERARRRFPTVTFDACAVLGPPRDQLAFEAQASDLLVVGSLGVGATGIVATADRLMGSVAFAVARTAPCPVVLVSPGPVPSGHDRVVVGVDESPAAAAALGWAVDEADLRGAELAVVHAWDYPYGDGTRPNEGRDRACLDGEAVVERAVAQARRRMSGPVTGELVEGSGAAALLTAAGAADLLVVGSRGRGHVRSAVFGSVAHTVIEHTRCPTVVVRHSERTT